MDALLHFSRLPDSVCGVGVSGVRNDECFKQKRTASARMVRWHIEQWCGATLQELSHAALNRQRWAAIVTMASDTNGRWAHGCRWWWWWWGGGCLKVSEVTVDYTDCAPASEELYLMYGTCAEYIASHTGHRCFCRVHFQLATDFMVCSRGLYACTPWCSHRDKYPGLKTFWGRKIKSSSWSKSLGHFHSLHQFAM